MFEFSRSSSNLRASATLAAQEVTGFSTFLCDQLLRTADDPVFVILGDYGNVVPQSVLSMLYQAEHIGRSGFEYNLGPNALLRVDLFYVCVRTQPGLHLGTLFGIVRISGGSRNKWGHIITIDGVPIGGKLIAALNYKAGYPPEFTPIVDLTLFDFNTVKDLREFFVKAYRE